MPDGRASSNAAKRRRQGVCLDCGGATRYSGRNPGGVSVRCFECAQARRHEYRVWTQEAIVEAIRLYAEWYGRPPSARDWNPAAARADGRFDIADRFYEDACWPQPGTVLKEFGRWNAAIAAAGFTPLTAGHKYSDIERRAS